ncbi:MAG: TonB-dependent receptor [Saprospiraceae bacterium]|nr:TonB-dependent receptor [Saprospiraceae bacterium]
MKEQPLQFYYHWLNTFVLLFIINTSQAQQKVTVLDNDDIPLIGVYVNYNGTALTTDLEGKFQIAASISDSINVSLEFVGFKDLTINIGEIRAADYIIRMQQDAQLIEDIIIVGRTNQRTIDFTNKIDRITAEKIYNSTAQSSADVIELSGGAFVQKSQMGGGSPSLRGFEANKILLVVDGVRMNNAIYRNGHLQNAITIDPSILKQVEIIYGAGSLLYGSEALGGVIHFRTKSPLLNFDSFANKKESINSFIRYGSANNEKKVHLDHSISTKKFGVVTSLTFSDFDDLRIGNKRRQEYPDFGKRLQYVQIIDGKDVIVDNSNPNIQVGTGYSQYDFLQKWVVKFSSKFQTSLNIQYSNSSNIPRYDNLSEYRNGQLRFAEWYYGPQERLLIAPTFTYRNRSVLFDKITATASFQQIKEDRISRVLNDIYEENQNEKVNVYGLTIDLNKDINKHQKITYGFDFHYNKVNSSAFSIKNPYSSNSETVNNILSRYPSGGSTLSNYGLFVQHNLQNKDSSFIWVAGLRWTNQIVNLSYDSNDPFVWPTYFYEGIQNKNSALVGITGFNIIKDRFTFKLSTGNSFRSPNVDDLAKIRVNGDEITIPNSDLKSEKVWNNDFTINYKTRNFSFGLTGYYTILSDAIIRSSFNLPNGSSQFISRTDTLLVTGNINAASGNIKGFSAEVAFNITNNIKGGSQINFQQGESKDEDGNISPLAHIPPTFGNAYINCDYKIFQVSLLWKYNAWKRIEDFGGSVDNPDLATIDGSPSWHTFNINSLFKIQRNVDLGLSLNNIFDIHYRPFSSGLSAPGRHVVFSIRYKS